MAEFSEADDVNHHILAEGGAVVHGHLGGKEHGLRVVAIHVEHGCLDHLDDIRAVEGGAGIARVGGGKANLVVDDNVHRTAGAVATGLGQVQGLHDHALAGKSRIAMNQHGKNLLALSVATTVLTSTH